MIAIQIRPVGSDEWEVVAWLWQCFRHDLAMIVSALPYPDGRYQTRELLEHPSPERIGYLAWSPHPNTGDLAPVGFALVGGLLAERRSLTAMWVAPVVRREGAGRRLALDVIGRHPGPWSVAFQHENAEAGKFWRGLADEAFGRNGWHEEERPVPGIPGAPPDHWIHSR